MLVLANGAFKSGSTWLRDVVQEMLPHEPIPPAYRLSRYEHWVDPKKLKAMLNSGLCADHVFISKSHIYDRKTRDLILGSSDVKTLMIKRDTRDVIVSSYYHTARLGKYNGSFNKYYWNFGRLKAYQILEYQKTWNVPSDLIYFTQFEDMKTDFTAEITKIGAFLGVTLTESDAQRIEEETSIARMRERRGESDLPEEKRFIRRGQSGGWTRYFDQKMLDDLERIQTRGLGPIDMAAYRLMFDVRLGVKRLVEGRSRFMMRALDRI
jgi:hypothetical protein